MKHPRKIAERGEATAWAFEGEVYIAYTTPTWGNGTCTVPVNSRWECSVTHWRRYFPTVHAPAGWVVCEEQEGKA